MATWKIDFTNVEDSFPEIGAGRYLVKVKSVESKKKDDGEYPYLLWELTIISGSEKGSNLRHMTTLSPKGLFNLRDTLIALGLKVPKSAVNVNPDKLIGKQMAVDVILEDYNGKTYPKVKKTLPASEFNTTSVLEPTAVSIDDEDDIMVLTEDDI